MSLVDTRLDTRFPNGKERNPQPAPTFHRRGRRRRGSRLRLSERSPLRLHLRPGLVTLTNQPRDHATSCVVLKKNR